MSTSLIKAGCAFALVALLAGCGKKAGKPEPTEADAPPKSGTVSVDGAADGSAPPPPPPAPDASDPSAAPPPSNGPGDTVDPALRAVLVKFYNEQLHPAQSWDELLAGKYITKIPKGPDGKPLDWVKTMQEVGRTAGRQ